eukprot:scaffold165251_cov17-Tisochrysis_lutea.AAC.1
MPCMQLLPFLGLPCARGSFAFWGMLYEDKLICIGQWATTDLHAEGGQECAQTSCAFQGMPVSNT